MRRLIAASILIAAATLSPAPALGASGCAVATGGAPSSPSSCRFTAVGPVDFIAATTSGWRIAVSQDGGQTWAEVARSATQEIRPTHANATADRISSVKPFDIVELSIIRANDQTPAGVVSYQHGFIAATSDF